LAVGVARVALLNRGIGLGLGEGVAGQDEGDRREQEGPVQGHGSSGEGDRAPVAPSASRSYRVYTAGLSYVFVMMRPARRSVERTVGGQILFGLFVELVGKALQAAEPLGVTRNIDRAADVGRDQLRHR